MRHCIASGSDCAVGRAQDLLSVSPSIIVSRVAHSRTELKPKVSGQGHYKRRSNTYRLRLAADCTPLAE